MEKHMWGECGGEGCRRASVGLLLAVKCQQGHSILLLPCVTICDRRAMSSSGQWLGGTLLLLAAPCHGPHLHWMLRLRYCRNMLASWGRFSSLGCILV